MRCLGFSHEWAKHLSLRYPLRPCSARALAPVTMKWMGTPHKDGLVQVKF